ncbi:hypothetical protein [Burkholderia latens]|uniref:hypothetical protein n=1 Tax=Burkholderia latens TaxID=488446 RepID=UPI0012E3B472|nr:hypothetical protein [Burkholderia latens]
MSLPAGESVAVSMSGALNVSVCDRKKHPVWLKLPFADLETIAAHFLEIANDKSAPDANVRGKRLALASVSARSGTGRTAGDGGACHGWVAGGAVNRKAWAGNPMIARESRSDADACMTFLSASADGAVAQTYRPRRSATSTLVLRATRPIARCRKTPETKPPALLATRFRRSGKH